jgi:hypothetical protein
MTGKLDPKALPKGKVRGGMEPQPEDARVGGWSRNQPRTDALENGGEVINGVAVFCARAFSVAVEADFPESP